MDPLDAQLIGLLRINARMSLAELSRRLKVPRGTANFRLRRLEQRGVIEGYTLRLHPHLAPQGVRAWTALSIRGVDISRVVQRLLEDLSVAAIHDTNGRWDLLVQLEVPSLDHLPPVLDRILALPGIQNAETSIHLHTYR